MVLFYLDTLSRDDPQTLLVINPFPPQSRQRRHPQEGEEQHLHGTDHNEIALRVVPLQVLKELRQLLPLQGGVVFGFVFRPGTF